MKELKIMIHVLVIAGTISAHELSAQKAVFDPSLDPSCKLVVQPAVAEWNSVYIWYPGQLSALLQDRLQSRSKERAVNVGYPDYFFQKEPVAYFRKQLRLGIPTYIRWAGPDSINFYINGKPAGKNIHEYTLPKGPVDLLFEVFSYKGLPCIIVDGLDGGTESWKASLDKINWNIPESYSRFNSPDQLPDIIHESTYIIEPYKYILFNNSVYEDGTLRIGDDGCAIIDFRYPEIGTVRLEVKGQGTLTFNVGESPEEALNNSSKSLEQYPVPEFVMTGERQELILPERALRFIKIESTGRCEINSIRFNALLWPVEHRMKFECNNERLNDIWKVASATMHTGMHDFYLDGIKRDGLPWAMDLVQSSLAGDYLFGDELISRNGLSVALLPLHPQKEKLELVDFPLYALIGFKENYLYYGDIKTSLQFRDRIVELLSFYESLQDKNGFISGEGSAWGLLPSWATMQGPDKNEKSTYAQMLLYENYSIGAWFADLWGDRKLAVKYRSKAEQLRKNIPEHFWDREKKAFINGYYPNGEKDERISHHAQFWGIYTSLFPENEYENLFENIIPGMTYYKETYSIEKGYEYLSYVKAGKVEKLMEIIDRVWGGWVDKGFTRFPENIFPGAGREEQLAFYDRPFGMSLCHPCNGVPPILAILHGVLGFSQSDQKIGEYIIKPNLAGLKWINATIPVKEGAINLHIGEDRSCSIEIPGNCTVILPDSKIPGKTMKLMKAGSYKFTY